MIDKRETFPQASSHSPFCPTALAHTASTMNPSLSDSAELNANELADLENRAHQAARLLKMMASEQRLILLCRLSEGEASVNTLSSYVNLAQSATSQHLAKMRQEGLVKTRRDAQTIYYSLSDPAASRIIDLLCDIYAKK